ncbi:MAG: FtsW/RodA/SpoVE family cell cycle protein [Candidatus Pacebacteria bacterium]|nr:FtsW/RodA/SpoVE family cell cycle protein [Candidatus Paceibacterota bacterium]
MKIFKYFNWSLLAPALLLTGIGLTSIYSASISRGNFFDFKKQLIYFGLSLILFVVLSRLDLRFLRTNSYLVFGFYLLFLLLIAGLLFAAPLTRGIRGWYKLGPVAFDPEPLAAISLIIVLAKFFSTRHTGLRSWRLLLFSSLYMVVPFALVFLQPDLGSSACFVAIWLGAIFFSGLPLKRFLAVLLVFAVLAGIGWQFFLQDYQKQRILSFLNPQVDQKGISWSVNQSKIAIGSAGLLGKGLGKGPQTQYGFLTEPKTDFIFSAWAEETGFLGTLFLFAVLFFLFWRIIQIAFASANNFTRLFASGLASLFLTQSAINIGMCLGLLPVVGIPLPMVSYGGNTLLAFYVGLGILTSLERQV